MIDISQEDFGTLCICALRYCHGRRSYMPGLVQEIVREHFTDINDSSLKVITDDKKFQSDMQLWGDECDKIDWEKFYIQLEAFRKTKEALNDE